MLLYFISFCAWVKIHTSCSCVSLLLSYSLTSSVERGAILTCFAVLSIAFLIFFTVRLAATKCLFLQVLLTAAVRCVRIIRAFLVRSSGFFKKFAKSWVFLLDIKLPPLWTVIFGCLTWLSVRWAIQIYVSLLVPVVRPRCRFFGYRRVQVLHDWVDW